MKGLFVVHYFDPVNQARNMQSVAVLSPNAEQAIKKADRLKLIKQWRVESVECLGFSDES
jgi:hypothetical protein